MWNRLDRDGKVSVLWYVLIFVGLSVWGLGFMKLEVGEWLAFVVLLGLNIAAEFNEAAARTGLRQAQADREKAEEELAKMKERVDEAERLLAEFYEELGIEEITRINYRVYKNKYLR